jgi:hypothetical protein
MRHVDPSTHAVTWPHMKADYMMITSRAGGIYLLRACSKQHPTLDMLTIIQ